MCKIKLVSQVNMQQVLSLFQSNQILGWYNICNSINAIHHYYQNYFKYKQADVEIKYAQISINIQQYKYPLYGENMNRLHRMKIYITTYKESIGSVVCCWSAYGLIRHQELLQFIWQRIQKIQVQRSISFSNSFGGLRMSFCSQLVICLQHSLEKIKLIKN